MNREPKRMEKNINGSGKLIVYIAVAVVIATLIVSYVVIANIIQSKKEEERLAELENSEKQVAEQELLTAEIENKEEDTKTESVSTQIGKTVEESSKEEQNTQQEDKNIKNNTSKVTNENKTTQNVTEKTETPKEITFTTPVDGEITRGFAKDNLVYSETLQEWIIHQAIDIKANSRDVVKSAAEGTVEAIKNDPRYGLTVIIKHENGFKTVYSNLLTAEFVVEGEQVKQGQTIGTVGSSATFEISDEPHLHFEMLKDSEYVDPTIYIK